MDATFAHPQGSFVPTLDAKTCAPGTKRRGNGRRERDEDDEDEEDDDDDDKRKPELHLEARPHTTPAEREVAALAPFVAAPVQCARMHTMCHPFILECLLSTLCTLQASDVARIITCNVGDCRAVLWRDGKGHALSKDHKPNRPDEKRRISKAGGCTVCLNGVWRATNAAGLGVGASSVSRRAGTSLYLAVSRAFGDAQLKHPSPVITVEPEITITDLTKDDLLLVVACDGVWDVLSSDQVHAAFPMSFAFSQSAWRELAR